ncbi:MAG: hypothetical protein VR74_17755 [Hyphomonas sp. BRH_c22]|uniref:plasmid pRiA4b ORF-3 family protein n=1 Tax=Hyphomonas sp. BRH_c22 TaxID=1629710 RepID=UPI0005F1422E|nr:plasmid pRiA4b ORF-3 family protein [Hyphomonas sp. BRH_c22]KJS35198.1 MAG: hypothetical protein VR74_17755 [Hyphomonas sp. BRH_c22]
MIDAARLRITLHDLNPAPWRVIEVPLSMSLKNLHDAIQAAFLWQDYHLWEFEIGDKRYGMPFDDDPDMKVHKASIAKLTRLKSMKGESFLYTYDFGDNWEHRIDVLDVFEAETGARLPRFIEGEYRTPPEDVGGPHGYEMFLEAISDPSHEEHDQMLNWYGRKFDPQNIDRQTVRLWFGSLAKARPAKK